MAAVDRVREAAEPFQGARILHLSQTRSGTHHARMLDAAVPLLTNLGLDVSWRTPGPIDDAMSWSDSLNQAIDGEVDASWPQLADDWRRYARRQAAIVDGRYDYVVIHDPQLLPLRGEAGRLSARARWVWHCHMDMRDCDEGVAQLLTDELDGFDLVAVENPDFAGSVFMPAQTVIPAVIDPLSGRNAQLPPGVVDKVLRRFDLRAECPLVVEVSPFDGWDDPNWAIHTYNVARKEIPNLQMALVATSASREDVFSQIDKSRCSGSVRLLSSGEAGDVEINALQGAAVVAMQNAVRKGFSTSLLEASWKGRPVLASEGGAMSHQVIDGTTGYLFVSFEDAAERIVQFVNDRTLSDALGFNGHRLVRENHLVVRWVEAYLNLLAPVAQTGG
ncbi:MAG: glycosyltransferase [Candidatus Dormibacter sp.]